MDETIEEMLDTGVVRALVIDDDASMREMMSHILLQDGHFVVTAASAEEALSYLPHYTFQVAFIDHTLPGMEGVILGEFLRKHNPRMGIALVTGAEDEQLARMCQDHRIHYIHKPFSVGQISGEITRYLKRIEEEAEQDMIRASACFHAPIAQHVDDLQTYFDMPSMPGRIERQLAFKISQAMNGIRCASRFNERDRVMVATGLLTARLLGIRLPSGRDDQTLEEEYDALLVGMGRAPLFTGESADDSEET